MPAVSAVHAEPSAPPWSLYTRVDSQTLSEPVSIRAALNDWQGRLYGGERQSTSNWLEAGLRNDRWSIGAVYRRDQALKFAPDTAEFHQLTNDGQALEPGRVYEIELRAGGFKLTGLRLARFGQWTETIWGRVGISLFQAERLLEGTASGFAEGVSADDYRFEFDVDYRYDHDRLFGREVRAPSGTGIALDFAATRRLGQRFELRVDIEDLLGWIRWQDAPFTRATARSDRRRFDTDGRLIVDAVISGEEGSLARFDQRLTARGELSLQADWNERLAIGLHYRDRQGRQDYGLGASWVAAGHGYRARWWPELETAELAWSSGRLGLRLAVDRFDRDEIRSLWLAFEYNLARPPP